MFYNFFKVLFNILNYLVYYKELRKFKDVKDSLMMKRVRQENIDYWFYVKYILGQKFINNNYFLFCVYFMSW